MLPSGLQSSKTSPYVAFRLNYRDPYLQSGMGGELYFSKSRGGVVSQWMKRHHESDYIESQKLFRIQRDPLADWITLTPSDDATGQQVQALYQQLTAEAKISLLHLGGIETHHFYHLLSKIRTQSTRESVWWISPNRHTGSVSTSEAPLLCDLDGLTERTTFTHFPAFHARTLTPLGQAVFLLVLQDYVRAGEGMLSTEIVLRWLYIQSDATADLRKECQSTAPFIFHKLLRQHGDSLGENDLPCRIYSGQWGRYWLDTSGYSENKSRCRVFSLSEAMAQVNHCGPEKGIYLALLSAEEQQAMAR